MTLTVEQWKELLDAVKSSEKGVLDAIKEELKRQDQDTYQEWEQKGFDINHLFNIELIINDKQCRENVTLLSIAARSGKLDIVKYFIEQGADVNLKDNNGFTVLHLAAENGHTGVVTALLEKGAKVDEKDANWRTPLHFAVINNHKDIVTALLEKGAKVDEKDANWQTPLHFAVMKNHKDIVTALLEKGADPSIKDKYGKTPRDRAERLLEKAASKAIKTGSICGIIGALAVGGGLFAAGVELPILALIGIAVAAALVIGVIAGGITYSVSKPSYKLDKPDLKVSNQQVRSVK
ncbi:MAG: ankyrin repeat domain-containing protein [Wolbachia endosymbiont of Tetragnatha montana]|nr:ankyrin repeat domain-containing protein [Wolbachia endosymbiont of Tetragnatha montana]